MSSTSARHRIRTAPKRATSPVAAPTGARAVASGAAVFAALALASSVSPASAATSLNKKVKDVCRTSKDAEFRAKYCTAAEDHKKGYVANVSTSAVWSGVSVVCGAACGKAVGGLACKVSSSGGTAGEGILTKKFVDAVLGEGAKWGGALAKGKDGAESGATAGAEAAAATKKGVDADACTTAGTSALKAYEKFSNSKRNEKGLEELRDQTKGMNTIAGQGPAHFSGDTQNTSGDAHDPNRLASSVGPAASSACDEAALATALGSVRCAAHADPALPPYLKSEDFLRDLRKATGKSPDAFFAGFENPTQAIADSAITKGMTEAQAAGLADSLAAMEGYAARKVAAAPARGGEAAGAAGYRAGGARNGDLPGASDDGFDVNGVLAGVLGQLGADGQPLAEGSADPAAAGGVARAPAGIVGPEDRGVSIFDRVKWRYGALSKSARIGGLVP